METRFGARRARVGSGFVVSSVVLSLCVGVVFCRSSARADETGPSPAVAERGSITGRVQESGGGPASGAKVTIVELRRSVQAGGDGSFRFDDVPPGAYLLEVVSPKFGSAVASAPVAAGQQTEISVRLDLTVHHEDVVVSAGPLVQSASSVAQPVSILDGPDLQAAVQPTLGETLAREPGVSATSYSPGVSRPVIRGQGGDRIRILEDGIGVGDASNVSEDHAVAFDPLGADRIEVVRGPATLLYGSNATGGVVNVFDGRIPAEAAQEAISGSFEARTGSNSDEAAGLLDLNGGMKQFGWHLDALKRATDDFESADGRLVNSDLDTKHGAAGASWTGTNGFLGASWGRFETNYGIPDPDEPVRIDMHQDRVDLRGEYTAPLGIFQGIKLRAGRVDYEHAEIEDTGEVGATFFNNAWEGRIEATHKQVGRFRGAFGVQYSSRDFEVVGEEAFVPPTVTRNSAVFAFEQIGAGKNLTFEVGARYETQDNAVDDPVAPDRSFNGVSGSGAVVWKMPRDYALAFTVSRSERLPAAEELYANGPHLATFEFQIGDPNLSSETGLSYDLTFRRTEGPVTGSVSLFATGYSDYIFLSPTGLCVDVDGAPLPCTDPDAIPEFDYTQADADFRGAEAHLDIDLYHADPRHVTLEIGADTVRAEEQDSGDNLPRITPTRYSLGVRYRGPRLWGLVEGRRTEDQTRTAPLETPTDGYTFLNVAIGWRILAAGLVHDIILRGTNLTDELARNHISPLKDIVPLPGRDIGLSYRLTF